MAHTPFYGERGGQVGDSGLLTSPQVTIEVKDTILAPDGQVVHQGLVTSGQLQTGDKVRAIVRDDKRGAICRNHTATHLLHQALREVLGSHVQQAGSLVGPDRLRFDFSHLSALTPEQLAAVETRVNEKIWQDLPVDVTLTSLDAAREMGATALFEGKYDEQVRVVSIADYYGLWWYPSLL